MTISNCWFFPSDSSLYKKFSCVLLRPVNHSTLPVLLLLLTLLSAWCLVAKHAMVAKQPTWCGAFAGCRLRNSRQLCPYGWFQHRSPLSITAIPSVCWTCTPNACPAPIPRKQELLGLGKICWMWFSLFCTIWLEFLSTLFCQIEP